MRPGRDVNVCWSALSVGSVVWPSRQEEVGFLYLRVAAGRSGKVEALVACTIVAASSVPTSAAHPGVMAPGVEHLVAQGAPVILLALEHTQAVADLRDELLRGNGQAKRVAGDSLPEFFGADLAFRGQGSLVHQTRLLPVLVVPCRIQGVRQCFLGLAQKALGGEVLVGW